jgi:hypothetical protein
MRASSEAQNASGGRNKGYPLVINVAIENGPFVVGLPMNHGDFP